VVAIRSYPSVRSASQLLDMADYVLGLTPSSDGNEGATRKSATPISPAVFLENNMNGSPELINHVFSSVLQFLCKYVRC
jgi:hypothetical protein